VLALNALTEHDIPIPSAERLDLIVNEAMKAQAHFFSACLYEPDGITLDAFVIQFVLNCVRSQTITMWRADRLADSKTTMALKTSLR